MASSARDDRRPPAWGALLRAASATAVTATAAVALGRGGVLMAQQEWLGLDGAVALGVLAVAALAAGVLALGLASLTAATAAQALGGSLRAADVLARHLTPLLVRRVVTAGIGVGLGLGGAGTAHATESDLLWVVTDQVTAEAPAQAGPPSTHSALPSGGTGTSVSASAPQRVATDPAKEPDEGPGTVEVRSGDSLWSIAAAHLGPDATVSEIAREWPRWHDINRDVVGDDPDVILPGQALHVPEQHATTTGVDR